MCSGFKYEFQIQRSQYPHLSRLLSLTFFQSSARNARSFSCWSNLILSEISTSMKECIWISAVYCFQISETETQMTLDKQGQSEKSDRPALNLCAATQGSIVLIYQRTTPVFTRMRACPNIIDTSASSGEEKTGETHRWFPHQMH